MCDRKYTRPTALVSCILFICVDLLSSKSFDELTEIEGRDYFLDEALGRKRQCSEICDIPTQYPRLCGEKCSAYTAKKRIFEDDSEEEFDLKILALILVAVLFIIVLSLVVAWAFREKIGAYFQQVRERLCERLVQPQQPNDHESPKEEAGNHLLGNNHALET